jgi:hypothetical protein
MKDDMQVKKQGTKYVPTRIENYSGFAHPAWPTSRI